MTQYKETEEKYQMKYKARFKREILVVNPHATEYEIEGAMQEGAVFSQHALMRKGRGVDEARAVLGNIEARNNDILRIEKTVIVGCNRCLVGRVKS